MNDALVNNGQIVTTPQKNRPNYNFHLVVTYVTLQVLTKLLYLYFVTIDHYRCCFTKNHYSLHRSRHMKRDNFEKIFNQALEYENRDVLQEVEQVFLRGEIIANGTHWLSRKGNGRYHNRSASRVC